MGSRDRIVPLIVAVALFMENMDSTVIATSLPAIAADIGTSPLALKLAVTRYLLSLAIFIPASGWTADRFGARTVFRAAIAVFVLGLVLRAGLRGPGPQLEDRDIELNWAETAYLAGGPHRAGRVGEGGDQPQPGHRSLGEGGSRRHRR